MIALKFEEQFAQVPNLNPLFLQYIFLQLMLSKIFVIVLKTYSISSSNPYIPKIEYLVGQKFALLNLYVIFKNSQTGRSTDFCDI